MASFICVYRGFKKKIKKKKYVLLAYDSRHSCDSLGPSNAVNVTVTRLSTFVLRPCHWPPFL